MDWRDVLNTTLVRATGYELRKSRRDVPPVARRKGKVRPTGRLVRQPAFILSTVRSGSTLLRVLLDSHSEIHSPQELHLRQIRVNVRTDYAQRSLTEIGLDPTRLQHLLWDRILHRELKESGKHLIVNKTPSDVYIVDEILSCWPDARLIFLLRHPAAIAASRHATRAQDAAERNLTMVLRYAEALERARQEHEGLTVRYEDLAGDPARETRRLCDFLGVSWEPEMLDYGRFDHGRYRPGLGDWREKIKSGEVQPPPPPPAVQDIPVELLDLCRAWGYLPAGEGEPAPADLRSGAV